MASTTAKRYFCDHCEQQLSKTTYFKHKRLFYDRKSESWKKERVHYTDSSEDFKEFLVTEPRQGCDTSSKNESHGEFNISTTDHFSFNNKRGEGYWIIAIKY
jgi:hypothetical protein